ncbi:hypothetical protein [Flagellimonas pacifica]|uniref:Histidine kinase N-terminal 7TM region domain-containing protein n=1 Tax=Flagellimonas pacifica TaxID=1247520 RepID=A0A285MV54_9FLAO|nr:hypothetical protein [Allomuricauda parva]SNZ01064.1 hypothetical protein SAMN06265377_2894 [Allomuricauda parva]
MDIVFLTQVSTFYGWWQFSVCLFAFLALLSIWYHIGKKQDDFGQVWLALSILCWSLSGLVEILYQADIGLDIHFKEGFTSVFSLLNSLFILLSLPWFRYLPKPLEPLIKSNFWPYVIGIPFVFALFPTLHKMFLAKAASTISELDVYYALLTLFFLGFVLWESFVKRRLPLLGWLSIITVFVTLLAQMYKLLDDTINLLLFSAIFKTSLIMVFFALALSWVKELTETLIPNPHQLKLYFFKSDKLGNKDNFKVSVQGFSGTKDRIVQLTPALYKLLRLFAERRLSSENGWLEIKPKNFDVSKTYDINDHNELKRLIVSMLDSLFGKQCWTKDMHYVPLKDALFEMSENRERRIRLLLPKESIIIEDN